MMHCNKCIKEIRHGETNCGTKENDVTRNDGRINHTTSARSIIDSNILLEFLVPSPKEFTSAPSARWRNKV